MTIEDPWCADRQHGCESLSNFLVQLERLDISIGDLKVVWNSDKSDDSAAFQASELRNEIERNYTGELVMDPRRRHEVRHFHDRVVYFDVVGRVKVGALIKHLAAIEQIPLRVDGIWPRNLGEAHQGLLRHHQPAGHHQRGDERA